VRKFELARRALRDLLEIWEFVSKDSTQAADRLLEEFYSAFDRLSEMPGLGHLRTDLSDRNVLFWQVHSYLVIYTKSKPLRIVRVLHAKRNVRMILKTR
jgi:plasmid stabilization system protein ParE